jgi:TonB family protein
MASLRHRKGRTRDEPEACGRSVVIKHFLVVLCVLISSGVAFVQAASADSCPIRLAYASQVGLGAQHGTAEYELEFGSGVGTDDGPFAVSMTADMSDGTAVHFNVSSESTHASKLDSGTSEMTLVPFATEVRSFRIDSARDRKGLSICAADSPYSLDSGSASESIRFDDGPTSGWPIQSPGAVEIADASVVLRAPLDYPAFAIDQGAQGEVKVFVVIGSDGSIESASIDRSSGYALLDQSGLEAARKSTFKPAHLYASLGGTAITRGYFIIYGFQ